MKLTAPRIRDLLAKVFPDAFFFESFLFLSKERVNLAICFPEGYADEFETCGILFDVDKLSFQIDGNELSEVDLRYLLTALQLFEAVESGPHK